MDGLKRRVRDSLRTRLSLWLSLAILSVASIAGVFAFFSAFDEAHELQDDVLREVATLFDKSRLTISQDSDAGTDADSDPESRVFVQMLSSTPWTASATPPPLSLPSNLVDGIQTVRAEGKAYRVLVRTLKTGKRLAVAQDTAVRDEIARNSALRTVLPLLLLVPILLLLVTRLVRQIFKPVEDLATAIDLRDENAFQPITTDPLPSEIRPFVAAINRLLRRVERSMDTERRFIADAAHELRSPLAALSLQAERLAGAEMSMNARERLSTLRTGIERGRALLDQLLALARAKASAIKPATTVSVLSIFRRVLEDLMPLAEAKGIDVGVVTDSDAHVLVNEVDLVVLIKNLVDNAIRYTPAGGQVDLSVVVADGATTLIVEDDGPGIPEDEWERVFDPFYRVLGSNEIGSGLGLSIVQAISARLGAKVSFAKGGRTMTGLRVMVTFP